VGGGIGVAPLPFLVETLLGGPGPAAGAADAPERTAAGRTAASVCVLAGVAEGRDLELLESLRRFEGRAEVRLATEDGAPGTVRGPVTALLGEALERAGEGAVVYACGPRPMLAAVRRLARAAGAEAWLSVEERMACGVGACRGCAVKVKGDPPYRLVCRDGPVFPAAVLDLEEGEEP
jgi:dihydroorotate dehydrogenase electron transfer subunit